MLIGYNTNGFAHHRLESAVAILAEMGYRSVALTLDYHALDPFSDATPAQLGRVRDVLEANAMRCVVETGARFLLDDRRKHRPTLLDSAEGASLRLEFLKRAVDLAADLKADAVSFWSGDTDEGVTEKERWERLTVGVKRLLGRAEAQGVRLAFEPEPGMFIDTMARYEELFERVCHPLFGLTLDVGHLYVTGEEPVRPHAMKWSERLWNVHIEDMRRVAHDHLMFGEGDIDFAEALRGLRDAGYAGGLHVELSRHSHDAVRTASGAMSFLRNQISAPSRSVPCRPRG